MKRIELENLAVLFRTNDQNLRHVSVLDAMHSCGMAFIYGVFCGTPRSHKRKLAATREHIAQRLCDLAKEASK